MMAVVDEAVDERYYSGALVCDRAMTEPETVFISEAWHEFSDCEVRPPDGSVVATLADGAVVKYVWFHRARS